MIPPLSPALLKLNPCLAARELRRVANAARGRSSQKNGTSFEDAVEAELLGLAFVVDVTRCNAIVHATGDEVLYREASGCDFLGLRTSGQGFAIECKSAASSRVVVYASRALALAERKPRAPHVTTRQRDQLSRYQKVAVAILAVRFAGEVRAWRWGDVAALDRITRDTPGWHPSIAAALEAKR